MSILHIKGEIMSRNQPKKLMLSRETVRDLTKTQLEHIEGGKFGLTAGPGCVETNSGDPCRACY